ncbi:MAG: homoserine dehydrogenase [Chloroflexi bacterium]|nr:homoserine dehydrogenase [Chloroflexota bacterium]
MTKTVSIALVGLGNVGRRVLELLITKEAHMRDRYNVAFKLVGASDSSGAAVIVADGPRPAFALGPKSDGLDMHEVLRIKESKQGIATLPKYGHAGMTAKQMLERSGAEALIELSPTNLTDGEPGLSACETAIERGMNVVLANKGPLVLAYPKLAEAAQRKRVRLAFSASVAGGLPVVNIGRRDLVVARIERIEGILNGTTNFILTSMAENGMAYADALKIAQDNGIAETDPTLDVEGYDAANKLLILAHAALDFHATLADVEITGITKVTMDDLARAKAEGKVIKLLCTAARDGDKYTLSVKPTALPKDHPMGRLSAGQMGVRYETDVNGEIVATIEEGNPLPTAAAVVRDMINLYWQA